MIIYLLLACLVSLGLGHHEAEVTIFEERESNGDEREMVAIDLKKLDGSEEIKLTAQLQFHLSEGKVNVNGNPIVHSVVNQFHMRVSLVEIERGVEKEPRLAPVLFRVLVLEKSVENGNDMLVAEVEFIEVEEDEVHQVKVTQIIWEGFNRLPVETVSIEESVIHSKSDEDDHHVFVNPIGTGKDEPYWPSHHHKHHHDHRRRHHCWFQRLPLGAKIAVVGSAALLLIGLLIATIICCRRRRCNKAIVVVEVPENVESENETEKKDLSKITMDDGEFHIEINAGFVSDKQDLIM